MTIETENDLINFLNSFEYGFELNENGHYKAVIKGNGVLTSHRTTFWGNKIEEERIDVITYNWFGDFVELIRKELKYGGIVDWIPSCIVFNSRLITPDCNKFARVVIDLYEKDESGKYADLKYETYVHGCGITIHQYCGYYSLDELKTLIVDTFNKYMEDHKERLENKKLYSNEGAIFKKCK
jgi:hypothetical protein